MATSKRNVIGLILTLALIGAAWAAEQGSAQRTPPQISNTRSASCIVNITVDPDIVPLTPGTAENLVLSSAVAAKAAREILAADEDALVNLPNYVQIEWLTNSVRSAGGRGRSVEPRTEGAPMEAVDGISAGRAPTRQSIEGRMQQNATLKLAVMLPSDVKPAADEFLAGVIENLRRTLANARVAYLDQFNERLQYLGMQRRDAQQELDQQMGLKPDGSGGHARVSLEIDADIQGLKVSRRNLEEQVQNGRMSLALIETKRMAIEEEIAKLRAQAAEKLGDDAVAQELEQLVKMNEAALGAVQKSADAGRAAPVELEKARADIAKARIELAKRKEEVAKSISGGQLDAYSGQISQMAIQMAEERARMDILRQRLQEVGQQLDKASAHDSTSLTPQVRMAQELVNALDVRMSELKMQQMNVQPPTVTVIGAN